MGLVIGFVCLIFILIIMGCMKTSEDDYRDDYYVQNAQKDKEIEENLKNNDFLDNRFLKCR